MTTCFLSGSGGIDMPVNTDLQISVLSGLLQLGYYSVANIRFDVVDAVILKLAAYSTGIASCIATYL